MTIGDDSEARQTACLRLSLQLGVISISDIVLWVDSRIVSHEQPAIQLLDLSLMGDSNPIDVMGKLGELAGQITPLDVIDTVLGDAHTVLLEDSNFGRTLAKGLYYFWVESGYPKEYDECCAFDDNYALADQGVFTEDGAFSRLLEFTGNYARDAN